MNSDSSKISIEGLKEEQASFLAHLLKVRGYSKNTIITYDIALTQALKVSFIEIRDEKEGPVLNILPYRHQIAHLKNKTIALKLSAIRSFIEYLREWHKIQLGLFAANSIRIPQTLPKPISHNHIMKAIEHLNSTSKLVILILYGMGLRVSELENLCYENFKQDWCRVKGKGNKERDVPILDIVADALKLYSLETTRSQGPIFIKNGKPLTVQQYQYILKKAFEPLAIHATPHQMRHSFATELLNHGAGIMEVSEVLGHESVTTTQLYTQLGSAYKREQYLKHPLCGSKETAPKS